MRDNEGRTPLHYACIAPPKYFASIYNRLIKVGGNENLIDKVCFCIYVYACLLCCIYLTI